MGAARAAQCCAVLLLPLVLAACADLGYVAQSIGGQLDLWGRERPVDEVLRDPDTPAPLKERLELAARLREFASRELALPDNASYRTFADLERPFVVWNVFAAAEFSVKPKEWCFPFAGCVGYRGYFSRAAADAFAAEVAAEGYDVYVGGVPAYSTLGWFADPLLNTFIQYPEAELARLMFHELAHQAAYAPGDTAFNESFAVAVENEGVSRWLARHGTPGARAAHEAANRRREDFRNLLQGYRARLERLYLTRLAPEAMREAKARTLDELEADYVKIKARWGGFAGYDRWFAQRPNNAQIASVAIYTGLVPQFEALLEREGGDLARFYAAVRELAELPRDERAARLAGR